MISTRNVLFSTASLVLAASALTVSSPASMVQCQPVQLSWQDGTAPYYVAIIPGGQPSAAALENLPTQQGNSATWMVDIASGQEVTIKVTDSTGTINYSDSTPIQAGTSTSCVSGGSAAAPAAESDSSSSSSDDDTSATSTDAAAAAATTNATLSMIRTKAAATVSSASSAAVSAASSAKSVASSATSAIGAAAASASSKTQTGAATSTKAGLGLVLGGFVLALAA